MSTRSRRSPLRLVVLGTMGRHPYGGQTWLFLNWLSGLKALGHDVIYVEDTWTWPYDPVAQTRPADCAYARRHIAEALRVIGLEDRWALRVKGLDGACWGRTPHEIDELYRTCDALLNIAAAELDEAQMAASCRIYIQTDPVTSELQLAAGDELTKRVFASHHAIMSY